MGAELGTSVKDLSATLSTFFVAFALGQLFVGPLSDRFGRTLVISGLCVFVVGSAVCAFATSLPQLIVGRVIQALGVCATSVLSRAIARDLFEGDALARALSLVMVAMAAAPGFLRYWAVSSTVFGWRATFGVVGVLAILLGIHYVSRLGETHSSDLRRPLALSAVAATYKALLTDRRFITSTICQLGLGLAVSVFAMAPAILMEGFGFSPLQLALFSRPPSLLSLELACSLLDLRTGLAHCALPVQAFSLPLPLVRPCWLPRSRCTTFRRR
jgi:DHA1 family bicyclomycin/chloramphenicol resistance-like MFS transporter